MELVVKSSFNCILVQQKFVCSNQFLYKIFKFIITLFQGIFFFFTYQYREGISSIAPCFLPLFNMRVPYKGIGCNTRIIMIGTIVSTLSNTNITLQFNVPSTLLSQEMISLSARFISPYHLISIKTAYM